jgi:hypothetical protein
MGDWLFICTVVAVMVYVVLAELPLSSITRYAGRKQDG